MQFNFPSIKSPDIERLISEPDKNEEKKDSDHYFYNKLSIEPPFKSPYKKPTKPSLTKEQFNGYPKLFTPSPETGYLIERTLDRLILNPFQMTPNQKTEDLDKEIQAHLQKYDENPFVTVIKKPIYTEIFPNALPDVSKGKPDQSLITSVVFSKKNGFFVYSSKEEKNNYCHIIDIDESKNKRPAIKLKERINFLAFDTLEENLFIVQNNSVILIYSINDFENMKTEINLVEMLENNIDIEKDLKYYNNTILSIYHLNEEKTLLISMKNSQFYTIKGKKDYYDEPIVSVLDIAGYESVIESFIIDSKQLYLAVINKKALDIIFYSTSLKRPKKDKKDDDLKKNIWKLYKCSHEIQLKDAHSEPISCLFFFDSEEKERLISGDKSNMIKIWDFFVIKSNKNGKKDLVPICIIKAQFVGEIYALDCCKSTDNPNSFNIISTGSDKYLRIWDIDNNNKPSIIGNFSLKHDLVFLKAFSKADPYSLKILTSGKKTLRVYDFSSILTITEDIRMHEGKVRALCLTPNNRKLISATEDKYITIWDTKSMLRIASILLEANATSLKVTSDNKYLILGSSNKTLQFFNLETYQLSYKTNESLNIDQGPITEILLSRKDSEIVSSGFNIKFWALSYNNKGEFLVEEKFFIEGDGLSEILAIAITSNGNRIISGGTKSNVKISIWDMSKVTFPYLKEEVSAKKNRFEGIPHLLEGHTKAINALDMSPNEKYLVSGSSDRKIMLWDLDSYRLLSEFPEDHEINVLKYFPDGNFLLSGSGDAVIRVWDMVNNNLVGKMEGHHKAVKTFAISSEGDRFYSGSVDKSFRKWSIKTNYELNCLEGHYKKITCMLESKKFIITGSLDRSIRAWDYISKRQIYNLKGHTAEVISLCFAEKFNVLISAGEDQIRFWDLMTREEIIIEDGAKIDGTCAMGLSGTDFILVTVSKTKKITRWNWILEEKSYKYDRKQVWEFPADHINILKIIDEDKMVTGDLKRNLILWDINKRGSIATLKINKRHSEIINSIVLSENFLISCGGEINIWDRKDFKHISVVLTNNNEVPKLIHSFSMQNQFFYYLTLKNTVKKYDTITKEISFIKEEDSTKGEITHYIIEKHREDLVYISNMKKISFFSTNPIKNDTIKLHSDRITSIELTPNGNYMISGSYDGSLIVWSLSSGLCEASFEVKAHTAGILSIIALSDYEVISAGYDNRIILWKLRGFELLEPKDLKPKNEDYKDKTLGEPRDYLIMDIAVYKSDKSYLWNNNRDIRGFTLNSETSLSGSENKAFNKKKISPEYEKNDKNPLENKLKTKKQLLFAISKMKHLEVWDSLNYYNNKLLINYEENDQKPKESEEELKDLKTMKTFTKTAKLMTRETIIENFNYPVTLCLLQNSIILGYKNGKIYHLNQLISYENQSKSKKAVTHNSLAKIFVKKGKNSEKEQNQSVFTWNLDLNNLDFSKEDPDPILMLAEPKCKGHDKEIVSLITSGGLNPKLISSSLDNTIKFWNLDSGNLLQTIEMSQKIDFQISKPYFLVPDRLLLINNLIYDIHNELVVFKDHSIENMNTQKIYCQSTKIFYSFNKKTGLFYECSLINNNLLFYMEEYCKMHNFFNKNSPPFRRILNGSCMIYPFYCNFLHLNALFGNKDLFTLKNIEELDNLPLELFTQKNSLEQTPISIVLQRGDKLLTFEYFKALFKSFKSPNTKLIQKVKFYQHHFKFYTSESESLRLQKLKKTREKMPTFGIIDYMITLMKNDKQDLSIISDILTHSLFDLNINIQGKELKKPKYAITDNENAKFVLEAINRDVFNNQEKNHVNNTTMRTQIVALPFITDSSDISCKIFFEELVRISEKNPIFSNNVLALLMDYKWTNIYQTKYKYELLKSLIILALFLVNFTYILPLKDTNKYEPFNFYLIIISTILDIFLIINFIIIFYWECIKIRQLSWRYTSSFWNVIDIFLCGLVLTSSVIDIVQLSIQKIPMTGPKIIYSYAMFLLWMRLISFFRGFDSTSFLLRLIFRVLADIRSFLLFILIFILAFSYSAFLLQGDLVDKYNQFDVFDIFYRLILGDFSKYDDFIQDIEISYFLWILWMMTTILLTIVILNLLISIISNTFNLVLAAEESMKTYERSSLITDFELRIKEKKSQLHENHLVGKYLLYVFNERRGNENNVSLEEMMETVKEIKHLVEKE